jgi:hypothetical protein
MAIKYSNVKINLRRIYLISLVMQAFGLRIRLFTMYAGKLLSKRTLLILSLVFAARLP